MLPGLRQTRQAILEGATTPAAAIHAAYLRACACEPRIHAFVHLPAPAVGEGPAPALPMAGIAVAVKDLIDVAGMPAAYGSPIYRDHRPRADARLVQRLRELGATVLGKSVTTEFAWKHPGKTRNPWNPRHTPGGSSSGSAAAVAAGVAPLALGTQTLGSIIRPAAYCGVVGFKPSRDAFSRQGVYPLAQSLDHLGFFTRDVADARHAWQHLREGPDAAGAQPGHSGWRIGLLQGADWEACSDYQASLLAAAARKLELAGAAVIRLRLPPELSTVRELAHGILAAEAREVHLEHVLTRPERVSAALTELVRQGERISHSEYLSCLDGQARMRTRFAQWFAQHGLDGVLTAPAAGEAPAGLEGTGDAHFCTPFTLLGVPAISIPAGFGPAGLPLGVQLAGLAGQDGRLLDLAQWCEGVIGCGPGFA